MGENKNAVVLYQLNDNIKSINVAKMDARREEVDGDYGVLVSYGSGANRVYDTLPGEIKTIYSLRTAPEEESMTLQRCVADLIGQIDIPSLATGLVNAASLIDISYNALYGISGAFADMTKLRFDIYQTVGDSVKQSSNFRTTAQMTVKNLNAVYKNLCNGNISMAITYLKMSSSSAKKMANDADILVKKFEVLQERTSIMGTNVAKVYEKDVEKQQELEEQLREFKAKVEGLQATQKDLEKRLKDAQSLYEKYDKEASKLQKQATNLQIGSMVCDAVGGITKSVASAFAGRNSLNINTGSSGGTGESQSSGQKSGNIPTSPSTKKPEPADVQQLRIEIGDLQAKLDIINQRLKEYPTKITVLQNELNVIAGTKKDEKIKPRDKSVVEKEINNVKDSQTKDTKLKKDIESQIKEKNSKINGRIASLIGTDTGDILSKYSEKFDKLAGSVQEAASAKEALAEEMLKLKFEIQEKQTENLSMLAEFTQKVKNSQIEEIDLATVMNSLELATTCLGMVVSILQKASIFWASLGSACDNLSKDSTAEMLKSAFDVMGTEMFQIYITTDDTFGLGYFLLLCQWYGIYIVSDMYFEAANGANAVLDDSLNRDISSIEGSNVRQKHWKLATILANDIEQRIGVQILNDKQKSEDFQKQIEQNEKNKAEINKQLKDLSEKERSD